MSKLKVFTAPQKIPFEKLNMPKIFLAGSIDMGKAEDWQSKVEKALEDAPNPVAIFNPRRKDWNSSWKQEKTNKKFNEQVTWELTAQERADMVLFHFAKGTKAPVSMLELGLFVNKAFIICPDGFYRKGNIDIVADRYGLSVVNDFDEGLEILKQLIEQIPYHEPTPLPTVRE